MTNVLATVAEGVKVALEGVTLSQRFSIFRSYGDWEDLLEDLETLLRVDVVPQSCLSTLFDRGKTGFECKVSILLRKLIPKENRRNGKIENQYIDQLVGDLQTVHEYFVPSQPTQTGLRLSDGHAVWKESSIRAPYSRKMLRDHGQYSGWCDITFRYAKTPSE